MSEPGKRAVVIQDGTMKIEAWEIWMERVRKGERTGHGLDTSTGFHEWYQHKTVFWTCPICNGTGR